MSDNTARGFLDDILANPDDDAPRLIFSDWLEDNGDPERAEFIRVQIARERTPRWDAKQVALRIREKQLIDKNSKKWRGELPELDGITWSGFRRGFVGEVTVRDTSRLKEVAKACWSAAPIECVTAYWPVDAEVGSVEPIDGLRELKFSSGVMMSLEEVRRLADAPLLSTLRKLSVGNLNLGFEGFAWLVSSTHLGNLESLLAPHNYMGNGAIDALEQAPALGSLTELDLSDEPDYGSYGEDPVIEPASIRELAEWSGMENVRSLTLSGNEVERTALRALVRWPRTASLRELTLRGCGLSSYMMEEFEDAPESRRFDVLDLGMNHIGMTGIRHLGRATCLQELSVAKFDRCELTLSDARELADAWFLDHLRVLDISDNTFYPEGLQALLDREPPHLHTLVAHNNDLLDEGVAVLADSPGSNTLQQVQLCSNDLTDESTKTEAVPAPLQNLIGLYINRNASITQKAIDEFAESPLGQRLSLLLTDKDKPFGQRP